MRGWLDKFRVHENLVKSQDSSTKQYFLVHFFQVVHVSSTMQRTFTKEHWGKLHSLLTGWKGNLHTIREQIGQLALAQIDLMRETQTATAASA